MFSHCPSPNRPGVKFGNLLKLEKSKEEKIETLDRILAPGSCMLGEKGLFYADCVCCVVWCVMCV